MRFFLRLCKYHMCLSLKMMRGNVIASIVIASFTAFAFLVEKIGVLAAVPLGLLAGAGVLLIPFSVVVIAVALNDFKTKRIFNIEGFSEYYLYVYKKRNITGRLYNEGKAVVYAEILARSGHASEAIDYLDSVDIPRNQDVYAMMVSLNMFAGVKSGDPAFADKVWQNNHHFISGLTMGYDPAHVMSSVPLYLSMICTDCANCRYEQALQLVEGYLNSKMYKRFRVGEFDFRILHLYILKKLGKDEAEALASALKRDIERFRHLYDWEKPQYLADFERALNGECPW